MDQRESDKKSISTKQTGPNSQIPIITWPKQETWVSKYVEAQMETIRLKTNIHNEKQETNNINEQDQNADADKEGKAVVSRSTNDASIPLAYLPHRSPGPSHIQPIPGGWPAKEHSDTETGHHGKTETDGRHVQETI